jgi:hypothetical protein
MDVRVRVLQFAVYILTCSDRIWRVLCLGLGRVRVTRVDKFKHRGGVVVLRFKFDRHGVLRVFQHRRKYGCRIDRLQFQFQWADTCLIVVMQIVNLLEIHDLLKGARPFDYEFH